MEVSLSHTGGWSSHLVKMGSTKGPPFLMAMRDHQKWFENCLPNIRGDAFALCLKCSNHINTLLTIPNFPSTTKSWKKRRIFKVSTVRRVWILLIDNFHQIGMLVWSQAHVFNGSEGMFSWHKPVRGTRHECNHNQLFHKNPGFFFSFYEKNDHNFCAW